MQITRLSTTIAALPQASTPQPATSRLPLYAKLPKTDASQLSQILGHSKLGTAVQRATSDSTIADANQAALQDAIEQAIKAAVQAALNAWASNSSPAPVTIDNGTALNPARN